MFDLSKLFGASKVVIENGKVLFLDNKGNAIAIMTFGAVFSLVILAVGVYAISQVITVANISSTNPLYAAIQAIPGGVVTIVGVVILAIVISLIAVALAIFAQAMPGGMSR